MKKTEQKPTKRIANGTKVRVNSHDGVSLWFWPKQTTLPIQIADKTSIGQVKFDSFLSAFDRYLVEVQRKDKKGQALPSIYYAPFAGRLEKQNPRAKRAPCAS